MAHDDAVEGLLRDILRSSAASVAELGDVKRRLDGTERAAQEARDMARDGLAQNIPVQIAELRAYHDKVNTEMRSDMVNAIARVTSEMRGGLEDVRNELSAHDKRIATLEEFRSKMQGAGGVIGWLGQHAPWIFNIILGVMAALFYSKGAGQ